MFVRQLVRLATNITPKLALLASCEENPLLSGESPLPGSVIRKSLLCHNAITSMWHSWYIMTDLRHRSISRWLGTVKAECVWYQFSVFERSLPWTLYVQWLQHSAYHHYRVGWWPGSHLAPQHLEPSWCRLDHVNRNCQSQTGNTGATYWVSVK